MKSQEDKITIIELTKEDAHLKTIGSEYTLCYYHDVSVFRDRSHWRIELTKKAFDKNSEKEYHGRLFEDHIEEPRVFAALQGNEQIGWIELGYEKWNNRMRVWEFLVEKKWREQGIGTSLMNHAVKIAQEKGARMLVLETQSNNALAIDFYLNYGFELIGLDTAAYSNSDIEKKEVRLELGLKL
jgi:ribosomal protein S18 acetylase RimI-like enzyme